MCECHGPRTSLPLLNLRAGETPIDLSLPEEDGILGIPFARALRNGLRLCDGEITTNADGEKLTRTRMIVLLVTSRAFHSPRIARELAKANELDIPVVAISIESGNLKSAMKFLSSPDSGVELERENPGVVEASAKAGVNSQREKLPTRVVKELDPNWDFSTWYAACGDIFKEIVRLIKRGSIGGGEPPRERQLRHMANVDAAIETRKSLDCLKVLLEMRVGIATETQSGSPVTLDDLRRNVTLRRTDFLSVLNTARSTTEADHETLAIALEYMYSDLFECEDHTPTQPLLEDAAKVVLEAMSKFGGANARVVEAGCNAIAALAGRNVVTRTALLQSGATREVFNAMIAFAEKCPEIVQQGCRAVRELRDGLAQTTTVEMRSRAAVAVVAAMKAFGQANVEIVVHGCGALLDLCPRADAGETAVTLMRAGAGQAVLLGMKTFAEEFEEVNGVGCETIARLASFRDGQKQLMSLGAGNAVVEALTRAGRRSQSVASAGCAAIINLSEGDDDEATSALLKFGADKAVVEAVGAFGSSSLVVASYGCTAIAHLCRGNSSNALALSRVGASGMVVTMMRKWWDSDASVARRGCFAIRCLAASHEAADSLMDLGAGEIVIAAMRRFGEVDAVMAEEGCHAVVNLASSKKQNRYKLMKLGADGVVVAAMRAFGSRNPGVAASGCSAIWTLIYDSEDAIRLLRLGAGEVVVEAMRAFGGANDLRVAKEGCRAIDNLLNVSIFGAGDYRSGFMALGTGEVLVRAIRTFGREELDVMQCACAAIGCLVRYHYDNQNELMRLGAGDAIIAAMRSLGTPAFSEVEYGFDALYNLIHPNNDEAARTMLRLGAAEMILAVMKAIKRHQMPEMVADIGCEMIARLAVDVDGARVLMNLGAGKTAVAMLKSWGGEDMRAAATGCWAVSRLAYDDAAATALMEGGAGEVVVKAMRVFGHRDEGVAEYGCRAIARLSRAGRYEKWVSLGGDEMVVKMLKRFGDRCSEVGDRACEAIVSLMVMTSSDPRRFWELGVGKCVMDAMRAFGEFDVGVAENGCGVLVRFARVKEEWRREMKSWGGIEELLGRIRVGHVGNGGVVRGVEEVMRLLG